MKFEVTIFEVHSETLVVEASNKEEAIREAENMYNKRENPVNDMEYDYTMETDCWKCSESI